jgi:hypothetical protein
LSKQEISAEFKKAIEAECDFTRVALDLRVLDRTVCIGAEMSSEEQAELLQFLDKNNNIFSWSTSNLIGVSREVIEHKLQVNSNAKPKKEKLCKMLEKKSRSCEGQSAMPVRRMVHQRSKIPTMVSQRSDGL